MVRARSTTLTFAGRAKVATGQTVVVPGAYDEDGEPILEESTGRQLAQKGNEYVIERYDS